jgi:hypothetical protein
MGPVVTTLGRVAEHTARELAYSKEVRCKCTACLEMATYGAVMGAPVEISRPGADVFGVPQALKTDPLVAMFGASSEGTFRLGAVPIDDIASVTFSADGPEVTRSARR